MSDKLKRVCRHCVERRCYHCGHQGTRVEGHDEIHFVVYECANHHKFGFYTEWENGPLSSDGLCRLHRNARPELWAGAPP